MIALDIPDPALSQVHLELAIWLNCTYLAWLIDCIRLLLPPGVLRRVDLLPLGVNQAAICPATHYRR
ncbi:MAG: hypothetical protein JXA42_05045 [Anaerolineales bacterium]|nr:hypothetical protein [Anaerolineales bacterium]